MSKYIIGRYLGFRVLVLTVQVLGKYMILGYLDTWGLGTVEAAVQSLPSKFRNLLALNIEVRDVPQLFSCLPIGFRSFGFRGLGVCGLGV